MGKLVQGSTLWSF